MNEDQTLKSLQLEFDEILTCIKPIYLSWKNPQDKTFIAAWIKKLTNLKHLTIDSMHLRNLYILALYENLRRDVVCDPFTKQPPIDELPPLSNHLKQLIGKFSAKQTLSPDWLDSCEKVDITYMENSADYEEDDYIGDLKYASDPNDIKQNFMMNSESVYVNKSNELDNNGLTFGDIYKAHSLGNEWLRPSNSQNHEKENKPTDDNDTFKQSIEECRIKYKPNEFNLFNKVQEKELLLNNISGMEKRLAQLQNAYHEDILKLRNQNEIEIQNVINRKNMEIDQIRGNYKDKIQEQEVQMQQLEVKANDCLKQLQMFQETKLKEIEQMKRSHNEHFENYNRENDNRVANLVDDFRKEKHKMQEEHRKREETLSKESKEYFNKLKLEIAEKSSATGRQIADLETDIVELKNAKNKIVEQNEKLKGDKENLLVETKKLQNDLNESQKRYQFIDNQHSRLLITHDQDIMSLKDTLETALHKAECSKDEIEVKAHDKIEELENQIKELQNKLHDSSWNYKKEYENTSLNNNAEKLRLKQTYEDEVENLKLQSKNMKLQLESKIQDLERKLDLKDIQLTQANKDLESKEKIAVQMVEDLRLEMTHNSDRQLRKKQFEFEQIESDLKREIQEKNKEVVDLIQQLSSHKQETEIKLTEIRKWSDCQISTLTTDWKQEKLSLEKDFQIQLTQLNDNHNKSLEKVNEEKNKKISELQNMFENMTRDIPVLKRELYQQVQMHKKEINDLINLYENEKTKLTEEHKIMLEKVNRQSNDLKFNIEEKHAENISQILSKTNEKLKEIEDEYAERSMQSFKIINDLKLITEKLKEEKLDLINSNDEYKNNLTKKYNSDIENMQKVIKMNLEKYKRELSNDQSKYKNLENQLERKDHEMKKQLNHIKFEYETKLSKLMPIDVQSDYEETIQSLRSQISFLQQRIAILEDEVNSVNMYKTYHNSGYSKHKCEQLFES